MLEDLVEVLDRWWSALDAHEGVDFVLNCFPFLAHMERDARTALLLEDLRRDENESIALLDRAQAAAASGTAEVLSTLEREAPQIFEEPPDDPDDHLDTSSAGIKRRLSLKPLLDDDAYTQGKERTDDDRLHTAIKMLEAIAAKAKRPDLRTRLQELERALTHAYRERRIFHRTAAGAGLIRIERDLADLHPPIHDPGELADFGRFGRLRRSSFGKIYERLFDDTVSGGISDEVELGINQRVTVMRSDVRRIYGEVRRRLGAERSLLAVFERYRQRSQWYEAERLRAIATAQGPGKPEDRLSDTLTTYLFDHGLNPLTRPLVGHLSPDLLGPGAPFSFYVEAKQYKAGSPGYLLQGLHQVWDMLDHLRGSKFDVKEAFYVVFRLGGPRYVFEPRVQHQDRIVHILMIDLAPTAQRGSNAPVTRSFTAAELGPQPAQKKTTMKKKVAKP